MKKTMLVLAHLTPVVLSLLLIVIVIGGIIAGFFTATEAAAIAVPDEIKGNQVVVICVLAPEAKPSQLLENELMDLVTSSLGKPLKPKQILFVDDLPKTRNAKVMRRMVRAAYLGIDPGDTSSLINPDSLAGIKSTN